MMVIDSTTLNDFDSFVEVSVKGFVLLHCYLAQFHKDRRSLLPVFSTSTSSTVSVVLYAARATLQPPPASM